MHIKELHEILQKITSEKITQNEIAKAIGTSRANVSKLFAKNSYINDDKIAKIERYFNISLNNSDDFIIVDYYPDTVATIKDNALVMSDKVVKSKMPTSLFPAEINKKYIMCHAKDDSMSPKILEGDFIIAQNCTFDEIENNKMYLFIYKNNIYIKYISNNINQIIVNSENKNYPLQYIEKDNFHELFILGKIVYIGRQTY